MNTQASAIEIHPLLVLGQEGVCTSVFLSPSGGHAQYRQVKGGAVRTRASYLRAPRLKDAAVSTRKKALLMHINSLFKSNMTLTMFKHLLQGGVHFNLHKK